MTIDRKLSDSEYAGSVEFVWLPDSYERDVGRAERARLTEDRLIVGTHAMGPRMSEAMAYAHVCAWVERNGMEMMTNGGTQTYHMMVGNVGDDGMRVTGGYMKYDCTKLLHKPGLIDWIWHTLDLYISFEIEAA